MKDHFKIQREARGSKIGQVRGSVETTEEGNIELIFVDKLRSPNDRKGNKAGR